MLLSSAAASVCPFVRQLRAAQDYTAKVQRELRRWCPGGDEVEKEIAKRSYKGGVARKEGNTRTRALTRTTKSLLIAPYHA